MPVHWRAYLGIAVLGTALAGLSSPATAQAKPGQSVLPGGKNCTTAAPPGAIWTEQEIWAWNERICLGRIADMSKYGNGDGVECDPTNVKNWPLSRRLRPEFLEAVLLHEPYHGALTRSGVRIKCAHFTSEVDLSNAVIGGPLRLLRSRFDQGLNLNGAKLSNLLDLDGSFFAGSFSAYRLEVGGMFMRRANFNDVFLIGAKIGGDVGMGGSTFAGSFIADGLEVSGSLFMRGANFNGLFSAYRNLSTTLRHRRFLFTDSFLLLWKWRVG